MTAKLLILDLDETLIHSAFEPLDRPADFHVGTYHTYVRPGAREFIAFCRTHFRVAVWTSSTEGYAQEIVGEIFGADHRLQFLWTRERCIEVFDSATRSHEWVKDLAKVRRQGFDLEQVLVVDDSPRMLARNYGNLIRVLPFRGDTGDRELRMLASYLLELKDVANVRTIDKRGWRQRQGASVNGPSRGSPDAGFGESFSAVRRLDLLEERAKKRDVSVKGLMAIEGNEGAIARDPADAAAHANLGWWWTAERHYGKALEHYDAALALEPRHLGALSGRADLRATCPDAALRNGAAAVRDAADAFAIAQASGELATDWKHRRHLQVLAAAHAENGDFDIAISLLRKALAFTITRSAQRQLKALLSRFESKQPLRAREEWN